MHYTTDLVPNTTLSNKFPRFQPIQQPWEILTKPSILALLEISCEILSGRRRTQNRTSCSRGNGINHETTNVANLRQIFNFIFADNFSVTRSDGSIWTGCRQLQNQNQLLLEMSRWSLSFRAQTEKQTLLLFWMKYDSFFLGKIFLRGLFFARELVWWQE